MSLNMADAGTTSKRDENDKYGEEYHNSLFDYEEIEQGLI